jgi:hypothetical protein
MANSDRVSRGEELRRQLLEEIARTDRVCRGTLAKRMKTCGQPTCRCHEDPKARHGPYYEWGRMEGKRLVNWLVSPAQAAAILRGMRAGRRLRRLLQQWERECALDIRSLKPRKP